MKRRNFKRKSFKGRSKSKRSFTRRPKSKVKRTYKRTIQSHEIHQRFTIDFNDETEFLGGYKATKADWYHNVNFALDDIPEYKIYTNMFRFYRFNRVVWEMLVDSHDNIPYSDNIISGTGIPLGPVLIDSEAYIGTCLNRDGSAAPDVESEFLRRNGSRSNSIAKGHKRSIVPNLLTPTFITSTGGVDQFAYGPVYKKWISTTYYDALHEGLTLAVFRKASMMPRIKFRATYYVSFKDTNVRGVPIYNNPAPKAEEKKEDMDDLEYVDAPTPTRVGPRPVIEHGTRPGLQPPPLKRNFSKLSITDPIRR